MGYKDKARYEATQWAHDLLDKDFVILDTETTDFLNRGGEVIQLGVVGKDGSVLMNQLLKPKGPISEGAQKIHNISKETVKDAPSLPEIYDQLKAILKDKLIIAYNANFDRPILNQTCRIWNVEPLPNEWDCAMLAYAKYHGEWSRDSFRWKKLTEAAETLRIPVVDAHDATGDVKMTLKVIEAMAAQYVPLFSE